MKGQFKTNLDATTKSSPKHWKGVVISKISSVCYFQILLLCVLCSHFEKESTWGYVYWLLVMKERYDWNWVDHPQQATQMTWVSLVDFKPRISKWSKFMFIHAYCELVWRIWKLGLHWRIQVNFKKAKNEESSSSKVEVLITHNSRSLYLMESCHMVDCQILILILWASTCYNG